MKNVFENPNVSVLKWNSRYNSCVIYPYTRLKLDQSYNLYTTYPSWILNHFKMSFSLLHRTKCILNTGLKSFKNFTHSVVLLRSPSRRKQRWSPPWQVHEVCRLIFSLSLKATEYFFNFYFSFVYFTGAFFSYKSASFSPTMKHPWRQDNRLDVRTIIKGTTWRSVKARSRLHKSMLKALCMHHQWNSHLSASYARCKFLFLRLVLGSVEFHRFSTYRASIYANLLGQKKAFA